MTTLLQACDSIEFVLLDLHFALEGATEAPAGFALNLRPLLRRIAAERLAPDRFEQLFAPPLPDDPTARRRYQLPAPPFAFHPLQMARNHAILPLALFGDGIAALDDFIDTIDHAARIGLYHGMFKGRLTEVTARDASGQVQHVWRSNAGTGALPPRITASWWRETLTVAERWRLDLLTPTRLVSKGKPLFQPTFRHLAPFVLRRVTSMLYTWCGTEIDDITELQLQAEAVVAVAGGLTWQDWKTISNDELIDLGGVTGSLLLQGPVAEELLLLLQLGSLMNIGKGAPWGAGCYRLQASA